MAGRKIGELDEWRHRVSVLDHEMAKADLPALHLYAVGGLAEIWHGIAGTRTGDLDVEVRNVTHMGSATSVAPTSSALLVVAHVDDHLAVRGEDHLRVLMLEAAEGGAFLGGGFGVEGVDLDDVARAVRLVGVPGDVEALVRRGPRIPAIPGADAVALERGADLDVGVARRKVAVEKWRNDGFQ